MDHEHVRIAVVEDGLRGAEEVPARRLSENEWVLVRSPLYAMGVAAGDVIRVIDAQTGAIEVTKRGGNVCVQFYLGQAQAGDMGATAQVAELIEGRISTLGGQIDGRTPGLISFSVGVAAGFPVIEAICNEAVEMSPGAQWQFSNVYDPDTGEPLGWWE